MSIVRFNNTLIVLPTADANRFHMVSRSTQRRIVARAAINVVEPRFVKAAA